MKILYALEQYHFMEPSAVTIGKFDGLHRGHRKLIRKVVSKEKDGLLPIVVTIEKRFDSPGILSSDGRAALLDSLGVKVWIRLTLSGVRDLNPEEFVRDVLVGRLKAKYVVSGTDFRFGREKAGDPDLLSALGTKYGFETSVISPVSIEDRVIDSTSIRSFLTEGRIHEAEGMLGRPYCLEGTVIHGRALGKKMGFPTLNVNVPADQLLPRYGVYFGSVTVEGKSYDCLIFIGLKETVTEEKKPVVEVHVPHADLSFYGRYAVVCPQVFTRPEKHFESVEALKNAVRSDMERFEVWKNEKSA